MEKDYKKYNAGYVNKITGTGKTGQPYEITEVQLKFGDQNTAKLVGEALIRGEEIRLSVHANKNVQERQMNNGAISRTTAFVGISEYVYDKLAPQQETESQPVSETTVEDLPF